MSLRFMLDTDSVSFAIRGAGRVGERIVAHRPSDLCMSAITLAELRYGVERRNSPRLHRAVEAFVRNMSVVAFDEDCAATYGRIGAKLAAKGATIGEIDTMIAAHALALGLTLVTSNTRHFTRVESLQTANWY
ncbi:MAG: PIN domain-containing protein [Thermoanaerobaculia bacterium]